MNLYTPKEVAMDFSKLKDKYNSFFRAKDLLCYVLRQECCSKVALFQIDLIVLILNVCIILHSQPTNSCKNYLGEKYLA